MRIASALATKAELVARWGLCVFLTAKNIVSDWFSPARIVKSFARRVSVLAWISFAVSLFGPAPSIAQIPLPTMRAIAKGDMVTSAASLQYFGAPSSPAIKARSPRVKSVARGLQYDIDRIYEFVRNGFEDDLLFGAHKGSDGLLIDGAGGSFDQTQLFVDLARESGFTARYVLGDLSLTAGAASVLRVPNDARATCALLAGTGTPGTVNGLTACSTLSGGVSNVSMQRVWAEVLIGGQWYAFDPSIKTHTALPSVDLAAAMGQTPAQAWAQVSVGAATQGNVVVGVNASAVDGALTQISSTLLSNLGAQHSAKALSDVVGGWRLDMAWPVAPLRQASLAGYVALQRWDGEIPDIFRAKLTYQAAGLNVTLDLPSVYGFRLQSHFAADMDTQGNMTLKTMRLYVRKCEGFAIATDRATCEASNRYFGAGQSAAAQEAWDHYVTIGIDHPFAASGGAFGDQTVRKISEEVRFIDVVPIVGEAPKRYETRRLLKDAFVPSYYVPASEYCDPGEFGDGAYCSYMPDPAFEGYDIIPNGNQHIFAHGVHAANEMAAKKDHIGGYWFSGLSRTLDLLGPLAFARIGHIHSLGVVSTARSSTDPQVADMETTLAITTYGAYTQQAIVNAASLFGATMEGAAVESISEEIIQPIPAVATYAPGSLRKAVEAGQAIRSFHPADLGTASLNSLAASYRPFVELYLGQGFDVVAPDAGNVYVASKPSTREVAWIAVQQTSFVAGDWYNMGTLHEPLVARKGAYADPLAYLGQAKARDVAANRGSAKIGSVDVRSGALTFAEAPDLVVGSGEFPDSLSFQRTYNSQGEPGDTAGMGVGWSHNWDSSLTEKHDVHALLEPSDVRSAAPSIVVAVIALEASASATAHAQVVASVGAIWWKNQAVVRQVRVGGASASYVRQVDGVYRSTVNDGSVFVGLDRFMADGSKQKFVLIGVAPLTQSGRAKLSRWTFPNGKFVALEYSAALPQFVFKVWNHAGHSLDFGYYPPCASEPKYCAPYFSDFGQINNVQSLSAGALVTPVNFRYLRNDDTASNTLNVLWTKEQAGTRKRSYGYNLDTVAGPVFPLQFPAFALLRTVADEGLSTPVMTVAWSGFGDQDTARVISVTDALGHASTYHTVGQGYGASQSAAGGVARAWFDFDGRPVRSADPLGRLSTSLVDGAGRTRRSEAPEGNATILSYDARGNVIRTCLVPKQTDPTLVGRGCDVALGDIVTSTSYVEAITTTTCVGFVLCNKPLSQTDAQGAITDYGWNATTGDPSWILLPADTAGVRPRTDLSYSTWSGAGGESFVLLASKTEKVTSAQSLMTAYDYDAANHFVPKSVTIDPSGLNLRTCYKFDVVGNLTGTTDPRASSCP